MLEITKVYESAIFFGSTTLYAHGVGALQMAHPFDNRIPWPWGVGIAFA